MNGTTAADVAQMFHDKIVCRFGCPRHVRLLLKTASHLQRDLLAESFMRILGHRRWDDVLASVALAHRMKLQLSLCDTPFFAVYGCGPALLTHVLARHPGHHLL